MTDEEALAILHERRGTMYDPLVVDVFSASYRRIMPVEEAAAHPAAKAVGGARAGRAGCRVEPPTPKPQRPPKQRRSTKC